MKVPPTFCPAVLCCALCVTNPCTLAEEFVGAEAVIRELQSIAKGETQERAGSGQEIDRFAKRIDEFLERVPEQAPPDVANAWLDLVDALAAMPAELRESRDESDEPHGLSELVAVLPGPEAWPALREAIDARRPAIDENDLLREQLLKMLAHVLVGDLDAQRRDLESIEQSLTKMDGADYSRMSAFYAQALATALVNVASDPELSVALLQSRIESLQEATNDYDEELEIPDLVTIAGPQRAEELLKLALTCRVPIEISEGVETKKLARKLAVEMIDELAVPQWRLCDTIEAVELYEALEDRFAESQRPRPGKDATTESRAASPTCFRVSLASAKPWRKGCRMKSSRPVSTISWD